MAESSRQQQQQHQWDAQLTSIIERTNANLSVLQSKKKKKTPSRSKTKTIPLSAAWTPSSSPSSASATAVAFSEEDLFERLSRRMESSQSDRVRRLEEELRELRSRTSLAVTSARAHENAVESLSRDSASRKSVSSKMLNWQADTEVWRGTVDAALDNIKARSKQIENLQRSVKEALSDAVSHDQLRNVVEEAKATSIVAAQAASSTFSELAATELDKIKAQVAGLGMPKALLEERGLLESQSVSLAIEAAVSTAMESMEKRLYSRLEAALIAKHFQHSIEHENKRTTIVENSTDNTTTVSEAQERVDRAAASLLASVDESREEARSHRVVADRRHDDYELQFRRCNRRVDECRDELMEKIGAIAARVDGTRNRLSDEIATSKKRSQAAKLELYGAIDARVSEWRDDAAELRRVVTRQAKHSATLDEKIRVMKVSARAYAEDAPGVRRAAALAAKFEEMHQKVSAFEARVQRIRDIEDRCNRDRARLERLENSRDKSSDAAASSIEASALREVSSRLGRVEEWRDTLVDTLASVTPTRLDDVEEIVGALSKRTDHAEVELRSVKRDFEVSIADTKDAIDSNVQTLSRALEDCKETASRAANDAAHAAVQRGPPAELTTSSSDHVAARIERPTLPNPETVEARERIAALERKLRDVATDPRPGRFLENLAALALRVDDLSAAVHVNKTSSPSSQVAILDREEEWKQLVAQNNTKSRESFSHHITATASEQASKRDQTPVPKDDQASTHRQTPVVSTLGSMLNDDDDDEEDGVETEEIGAMEQEEVRQYAASASGERTTTSAAKEEDHQEENREDSSGETTDEEEEDDDEDEDEEEDALAPSSTRESLLSRFRSRVARSSNTEETDGSSSEGDEESDSEEEERR